MRKTTRLQRAYRYYNRKYFNSELPPLSQVTIKWGDIDVMGLQAGSKIVINQKDRTRQRVWKFTLLHEMVHLSLDDYRTRSDHGREFQNEMLRLAKAGAFRNLW